MKNLDVYFYEAFEEEEAALASLLGADLGFELTPKAIQETGHPVPPARLISIRTQSLIPVGWADKLDAVLSRSTGYDHLIAYKSATRTDIPLGYLEEYATRAVAEHAIMMAMALMRKLPQQTKQFPAFHRDGLTGVECKGKKLLVVGVGRIGHEIVLIARGLGFVVKGVDIVQDKPDVDYISKEAGIPWADVIINAMNLTDVNRGYFGAGLFRKAKRGAFFVNIARGEHSPLADLNQALADGLLAGVALDVFEDESAVGPALRNGGRSNPEIVDAINRLLAHRNVLLTPHNAFNSEEALRAKAALTVKQIRHFLKHRDFLWKVR